MSHDPKKDRPCECPHCTMCRIVQSKEAERIAPALAYRPEQNAPSVVRLQ